MALMTLGVTGVAAQCVRAADTQEKDAKQQNDEGAEVKVTIDQVPAAVKDTFQKEAGKGTITGIDKETKHGKTLYEADVMIEGKNWEIVVGEDGKLISKKLDEEKDEQGQHEDKD
jgi:hypothetical protein